MPMTSPISTLEGSMSASVSLDRGLNRLRVRCVEFGIRLPADATLIECMAAMPEVMSGLKWRGPETDSEEVRTHLAYLAGKAGLGLPELLAGADFEADPSVVAESLGNIVSVIERSLVASKAAALPADVMEVIIRAEDELTGWCSREKAVVIAESVLALRPAICVEIGVYGGRSAMPCAAALRSLGKGVLYGIESWSPRVAIENATNDLNDDWWSKVDFNTIKRDFFDFVGRNELTQFVRTIEAPSARVAGLFDRIDYLHIDGSHSVVNAAEDVILYAQKVRPGGIIVFDDVNWATTAPAMKVLEALCDKLTSLRDTASGLEICAVLRRK